MITNDSTSILDLSSRKQSRSRSDSEHSTEPLIDPSSSSNRRRNNLSESEVNNDAIGIVHSSISPPATTANTNKSNLARTAILSAAKRAACNNNPNNHDGSAFTLIDGAEDEADSSAGLLKQRFDAIDLTDEVKSLSKLIIL